MRTKSLIIAAAALSAGLLTASAQSNVYSLNIVGYVNIVSPPGFSIIANPLDAPTNTIGALLPAPANGTILYKFGQAGYQANNYFNGWGANATNSLNPGEGAFIFVPGATPATNTFVGNVKTGTLTNSLRAGFTLVGSTVPVGGLVETDLDLPVSNGTIVYKFGNPNPGYNAFNYFNGWSPEPSVSVGEGFFVFKPVAIDWVQNFTP